MSRLIRRIRKPFTRTEHCSQQEDVAAESSHMSTEALRSRPPLEVLYPDPDRSGDNKIEVDIVAVHGLGSNVDWSWTWQDKEGHRPSVHWLKDTNMLPSVVPHARIIAYNYESRWHANAPKTRLELCGEELINSLHNFRTDALERPIMFIAHSLGGLVVSHALLYADRTEQLRYIPLCTVGFAPLGTPFRGTRMQSLAKIVAQLMAPMGSHDGIITELEQDSKHLADDVHAFAQLRNKLDIPTTSFFELYDSDYGKKIGVAGWFQGRVVEEASAHVPGWGRAALPTDHFKLNKFSGPDDRSFQAVSGELRKMSIGSKSVIERRKQIIRNRHFMVPFGRNNNFIGRDVILEKLIKTIPPNAEKDGCQRTAVEGLGGVGKTQIALEAAYRVRDVCSVFWVPAFDLTSFENAYREIGQLLQLPDINNEKEDVKSLVKRGLSHQDAGSWLLIVDNADDPDLLFQDAKLADYLPFSLEGSILITTRNHQVAVRLGVPLRNIVTVQGMSDEDAAILLRQNLNENQTRDINSTRLLLEYLANLPLAIKQASAYMESNTNVTISDYFGFCKSSNTDMIDLLSRQFEDLHRYPGHAKEQNPIATTWLISFNHIVQHNPLAADTLKFVCFLAEKDIPEFLLPAASERSRKEAIGTLKAYAFITERDTSNSFDIHPLVRLVMRSWLQEKREWEEWTTAVVQRLREEYPYPTYENKETWVRCLPHGQAVLDINGATNTEGGLYLLSNIAASYSRLGKYSECESLLQQVLEIAERVLGTEHPNTLIALNNLAVNNSEQGKHEEAEKLHRKTLELREKVLGSEHRGTFQSKRNLASVLIDQGKYGEAEKIVRQTLEIQKKVLGREHSDTLDSETTLAVALGGQKKYEEAEKIHWRTLKLREKVLGGEHYDTLISRHDLAWVLANQGKHEEAEKIYQQTLEQHERVIGREHPHTLKYMHNLADALAKQGKYEEAEKIYQQTLEQQERVIGREHPHTLKHMHNLADALAKQGKHEEAEKTYRQTLEIRERVLGAEHSSTLVSRNNLAVLVSKQGRHEEAERLYRQTLEQNERAMGREHLYTLIYMSNLGDALKNQRKYEEAENVYRELAERWERAQGREHPQTRLALQHLAEVLREQGKS
ncbi:hypothetical protein F5Y14DRAFT_417451 [Nemania sp. NC0429]|nr:hypothetical protein F5Y14DRAFT_417451 [Nemania sp. NC0429]